MIDAFFANFGLGVDRAHEKMARAIDEQGIFEVRKAAKSLAKCAKKDSPIKPINEVPDDGGRTYLHKVVMRLDVDEYACGKARELIAQGADMNMADLIVDERGYDLDGNDSPLTLAIQRQHVDMVTVLLKSGQRPEKIGNEAPPPLARAIDLGNAEIVQLLINAKADAADEDHLAFARAVKTNLPDLLKMLFGSFKNMPNEDELRESAANADMNDRDAMTSTPILHGAVEQQSLEMVNLLLANRCEVDALDAHGRTALMVCAMASEEIMVDSIHDNPAQNMVDIAKVLVEASANPHLEDHMGFTPIIMAARRAHKKVCLYFHTLQERPQELAIVDGFRRAQDAAEEIPDDFDNLEDSIESYEQFIDLPRGNELRKAVLDKAEAIKQSIGVSDGKVRRRMLSILAERLTSLERA